MNSIRNILKTSWLSNQVKIETAMGTKTSTQNQKEYEKKSICFIRRNSIRQPGLVL